MDQKRIEQSERLRAFLKLMLNRPEDPAALIEWQSAIAVAEHAYVKATLKVLAESWEVRDALLERKLRAIEWRQKNHE